MDKELFQERIKSLASFSYAQPDAISRFGKALMERDDWGLYRINPIRFAHDHDLDPAHNAIDLFVCASRIGLFDLSWHLICPACGGVLNSTPSINQLNGKSLYCALCDMDVPIILDDYVEITFTINPDIHELTINPYENMATFRQAFFSQNFKLSEPLESYLLKCLILFDVVWPRKFNTSELHWEPGNLYRLVSVNINSGVSIFVDDTETCPEENQAVHVHLHSDSLVRKRNVNDELKIRNPSTLLSEALHRGTEFLHVVIDKAPDQKVID